tara:strand:+ start:14369 stop:14557 length:189 start_codon:yes stop_codon:yes gene_type:complete
MNKRDERALRLVDYLISEAEKIDEIHRHNAIKNHKASEAVGESSFVFHLKVLKELLESSSDE